MTLHTSRETPASGLPQPYSVPWWDPAHPTAGRHQPLDTLSTGHVSQHVNISSGTPWALQPAVSGTSPIHQWTDTSTGTHRALHQGPFIQGLSLTHLQVGTSPRTPRGKDLPTRRLGPALRHTGSCSQQYQELALPTSRPILDTGPPSPQPSILEHKSTH